MGPYEVKAGIFRIRNELLTSLGTDSDGPCIGSELRSSGRPCIRTT